MGWREPGGGLCRPFCGWWALQRCVLVKFTGEGQEGKIGENNGAYDRLCSALEFTRNSSRSEDIGFNPLIIPRKGGGGNDTPSGI